MTIDEFNKRWNGRYKAEKTDTDSVQLIDIEYSVIRLTGSLSFSTFYINNADDDIDSGMMLDFLKFKKIKEIKNDN